MKPIFHPTSGVAQCSCVQRRRYRQHAILPISQTTARLWDRDGVDSQPLPASSLPLARFMLDVKKEK